MIQKSTSLKYERSSEPFLITAKQLLVQGSEAHGRNGESGGLVRHYSRASPCQVRMHAVDEDVAR